MIITLAFFFSGMAIGITIGNGIWLYHRDKRQSREDSSWYN